uniref:MacB-like periplasmic core domain-containing protein n=1 Tax=Loigolactobacillus rennini TaxID=238013 RepID=A0A1K2I719_9LACO|nr:hypothetical protein LREN565_1245 [Loigolactobacillus rennini]
MGEAHLFKRKSLLVVLLAAIAFLGVLFFSQMNRIIYQDLLDHAGLSTDTRVLATKKHAGITTINQKLAQHPKLTNYQIQYRQPHSKKIFVYGAGDFKTLPLVSGRFFSDSDFDSPVPVAIVGQNIAKKLYTPTSQSYLKYGKRYLSVIGVVGAKKASQLDNMVFISTSPQQSLLTKPLNQLQIHIDGKPKLRHLPVFKHIFAINQADFLFPQSTPFVGLAWLKEYWWFGGALLLISGLFLVTVEFWLVLAKRMLHQAHFYTDDASGFYWRELRHFAFFAVLGIAIGGLLGAWRLYILQYDLLAILLTFNALLCIIYYGFRLRHTLKTIRAKT